LAFLAVSAVASPAIIEPTDGATVSSPVTVKIAPDSLPATAPHGAHLHLLVDSSLPKPGDTIPMDAHHLHLMHGETSVAVPLAPGSHTLQLLVGSANHHVSETPEASPVVTFTVK
jgi:hypothetical protein